MRSRLLFPSIVALGLMSVCMAKADDAGASAKADPPAPDLITDDLTQAAEVSAGNVTTAVTDSPDYILVVQERDASAAALARLGAALEANGLRAEVVSQDADVDAAIYHLSLLPGYTASLEEAGKQLLDAQARVTDLELALTGAQDGAAASEETGKQLADAQGQVQSLTDQVADLKLALESAQARATRIEREAEAEVDASDTPAVEMELRQYQGRRRLVPRNAPG